MNFSEKLLYTAFGVGIALSSSHLQLTRTRNPKTPPLTLVLIGHSQSAIMPTSLSA